MVWTVLGTAAFLVATAAWLIVLYTRLGTTGLSTGLFGWLFARGIWQFASSMESRGSDDPVYKRNLQRLIERNRKFEEERNERHS